jgi:hypothetical protein
MIHTLQEGACHADLTPPVCGHTSHTLPFCRAQHSHPKRCPVVQAYGQSLADALTLVLGDLTSRAMISLFAPMHLMIQLFSADAVALLSQPLIKLLHMLLSGEVHLLLLFMLCWRGVRLQCMHAARRAEVQ